MVFALRRRIFIAALGSAAAAWPLAARAQQAGKPPTIGFLGTASSSAWAPWVAAFVKRLAELGWVDGRTITVAYRWTGGNNERVAADAAEFVRLHVDAIVTGGAGVAAAKQATSTIPIVFALASDPLGGGFVASLARPGGNVTGMSLEAPDLAGKRLQLLRQISPGFHRIAILANAGYPAAVREMDEAEAAARSLGLDVAKLKIQRAEEIAPVLALLRQGSDALYICTDPLTGTNKNMIVASALAARAPTMFVTRDYVQSGGLMSYGPNFADLFRRTAELVDKILRGAKPTDLPVEQPTKFDLVINLRTAKALGLEIPPTLLALADEVIE